MSIWLVIGLALLPALGNFSGGLLAEYTRTPQERLNKALHAAAGIVIAVVAVEAMPEALSKASGWIIGVCFGLGGLANIGMEALIGSQLAQGRKGGAGGLGVCMIYMAVAMDLI
jgi:ZIP family zinc transporter